ncbi:MAG: hypothetical protein R3F53_09575 [Gammaproteobacteria bacterium]
MIRSPRWLLTAFAVLFLLGLTTTVAVWFVHQERLLYYSDIRFYHQLTLASWHQLQAGLQPWLAFLQHWFGQDYNALFTLPLVPGIALGGESRPVYVALLALCYLSPAALLAGLLGRTLYRAAPRHRVFWMNVLLMLSTAALWQPVLRGYPDAGGVVLISLALWLYVQDSTLQHWRTVLGLAVLSGLTILFRRHFGYAVVALYAAIGTTQCLLLWHQTSDWSAFLRALLRFGLRLAGALLGAILLMALLAPEFTWRALAVDYGELYRSFQQTPGETWQFLWQGYGLVLPGLAMAGWWLAWRRGHLGTEHVLLCALLAGFWIVLFVLLVRQPGHHYRIHWLPLLSGLGLSFLVLELWRVSRLAALAVPLLALAVAGYAVIAYNTGLRAVVGEPDTRFWPEPVEAWRYHEKDYDTYLHLAAVLHRESARGERLYVATSSPLIGDDILLAAEEIIAAERRLNPLPVATVDSRDFYPVVTLLAADLVLIPQPALLTAPAQQQVMQLSVDVFAQHWPFSDDFKRLPEQFQLSEGTQLYLYRRQRPTSVPVLIKTLARMRAALSGVVLGTQTDWISADWNTVSIQAGPNRPYPLIRLSTHSGQITPPTIVSAAPLPPSFVLRGQVLALDCTDARLQVDLYDADGQYLRSLPAVHLQAGAEFDVSATAPANHYLGLSLTSDQAHCSVELTALQINSKVSQ